ncbi:MAG: enoyl-CoA hydratase-related protein [Thermoanaerobaculia bacterium]
MSEVIKKERIEKILLLKISRPEALNALNREVLNSLEEELEKAENDREIGGIIITGEGEKAFVAGADIKEFSSYGPVEAYRMAKRGQEIFSKIENFPKPVIAAVNGFALGGGCELALSCHIRIASKGAKFGQPEVNLGIIPGYGGTQRLPRIVGLGRALEIILSGKMIDAEEAFRIGLVNKVVEKDTLIEEAKSILNGIIEKAPLAVELALKSVISGMEMSKEDGLKLEASNFSILFSTEDMKEGVKAFIEKRKPDFKGK